MSDAPPSALLLGLADDLAARATLGQGLTSGEVATLARRIRDYAADVDATERYAGKMRQQIDNAKWWSDGDE